MAQFARWMADALASGIPEPTAMVLSTITDQGRPRARTVLLKAHDQTGFTFYSNRTSRKGRELAANPAACLVFPWCGIERQVIAEGRVRELTQAQSEPYFRSRPRGSQLGAWASRQSTVIASRTVLDDRAAELERRWPDPEQVPMPDFWGGYLLEPDAVEFWQAGVYRLHDRLRYRRADGGWAVDRLSPLRRPNGHRDESPGPFGFFGRPQVAVALRPPPGCGGRHQAAGFRPPLSAGMLVIVTALRPMADCGGHVLAAAA